MSEAVEKRKSPLRQWAPLMLLIALGVLVYSQGWHHYLSLEFVADNRDALQGFVADTYVLAIIVFAVIYAISTALSLPGGVILTILGGFLFGPFVGGGIVIFAATIGATGIFLIARSSVGEPLAKRAGPWLEKLRDGFQDNAMSYLLFLRLVPAFPFWLVNLAPALLGVPMRTYVIGTFFGIIPGTFAFAFVGGGLDSIIAAQRQSYDECVASGAMDCAFTLDPGALITTQLLLAFAALGVVALLPVVVKRLRSSN
ncbi:MAG: TVP38/TMEM64 family protein [Alphaproteobacteria bacterium]